MSLTRPGQVVQHHQWYFVCVSSRGQLWISDSVECGHKMKRIHDGGGSMNSPGVGAGGSWRQKLCLRWQEPIPCHQAEKAFCFFELSTGWPITSESTVKRDNCNGPVEVYVSNFCSTHYNQRSRQLIKSVQCGPRVKSGVQGNDLKK